MADGEGDFPGVASSDIHLHPVARAAWIGLLATSWNLLPIGQLDGGHILYSVAGKGTGWCLWIFLALLAALGIWLWHGWLVWAVLLFFRPPPPSHHRSGGAGNGAKTTCLAYADYLPVVLTPAPLRENAGF
jgi:hypothetical protein